METKTKVVLGVGAVAAVGLIWGGKAVVDLSKASETEKKYAPLIKATEAKYGIPSGVLHRMIKAESAFRPDIITGRTRSRTGAMGIAQFMPATAREVLGSEAAALDPDKAIDGAGKYLRRLYGQAGSWEKAVAAYNWGIGNVLSKGLAQAPKETRDYLNKVMA